MFVKMEMETRYRVRQYQLDSDRWWKKEEVIFAFYFCKPYVTKTKKNTFFVPGCTGFLTELGLFLRILDWTVNNAQIIEKEESDDGKKWSERIKFGGMQADLSVKWLLFEQTISSWDYFRC